MTGLVPTIRLSSDDDGLAEPDAWFAPTARDPEAIGEFVGSATAV
jgi:hypothetical protein